MAELGENRHQLTGPIAFAAWLGLHAALLTTTRAKIGALIDWAWSYFGKVRGEQILDRPSANAFSWGEDEQEANVKKE